MAYIVVSHRVFTEHFIVQQDVENALRERSDVLAWSRQVRKRYESSAGKDAKLRNPREEVLRKLKDLKRDGKAKMIKESKIKAEIEKRNLQIPQELATKEYTPFINLAEAVSASYLITGGEMLSLLNRNREVFNFTPIEANAYV